MATAFITMAANAAKRPPHPRWRYQSDYNIPYPQEKQYPETRQSSTRATVNNATRVFCPGLTWLPSPATRICSAHFVDNCKNDAEAHPSYIPTIFPPVYKKKAPNVERAKRMLKQSSRCQPMPPPVEAPPGPDTVSEPEATTEAESSNWDSFTTLVNTAAQAMPTKRTYRSSDIPDEDKLVLFLMKLKLGNSYTALAALFSVHKTTAFRIFRTLLDTLSVRL
ncbi:hypothetical protein HPB47_021107 [Ixodes persulcatus]|uniref:Uncharacterized protein n=1 Tax=Ixodes persulcatus TaxID=34615 RepID=A0AC60QDJ9_IXOPE|nr:hypothetical protein HPB47_021107 [Ixodes persulcatus]